MIEHLRLRAAAALASCDGVTFVTCGPSGPQASRIQCSAQQTTLYVYVPQSSDHLFNLERVQEVVALAAHWELRGTARILDRDTPAGREHMPPKWHVTVEIQPIRLQILHENGLSFAETFDF